MVFGAGRCLEAACWSRSRPSALLYLCAVHTFRPTGHVRRQCGGRSCDEFGSSGLHADVATACSRVCSHSLGRHAGPSPGRLLCIGWQQGAAHRSQLVPSRARREDRLRRPPGLPLREQQGGPRPRGRHPHGLGLQCLRRLPRDRRRRAPTAQRAQQLRRRLVGRARPTHRRRTRHHH